jgi:1,4-alpha-glucan branching enzyme
MAFFYHDDSAESVALAGDFNNWNTSAAPFIRNGSGVWTAGIDLPSPGRYRYKFVVNGNRWIDDPSNGVKEPDNYGGLNSVIRIDE